MEAVQLIVFPTKNPSPASQNIDELPLPLSGHAGLKQKVTILDLEQLLFRVSRLNVLKDVFVDREFEEVYKPSQRVVCCGWRALVQNIHYSIVCNGGHVKLIKQSPTTLLHLVC